VQLLLPTRPFTLVLINAHGRHLSTIDYSYLEFARSMPTPIHLNSSAHKVTAPASASSGDPPLHPIQLILPPARLFYEPTDTLNQRINAPGSSEIEPCCD
jgi:hypothetical protein